MNKSAVTALTVILPACAVLVGCAHTYQPTEYPLRDGLIAPLTVSGAVTVTNAQSSTATVTVNEHVGYAPFNTDLKTISEAMVAQTRKELSKNGGRVGAGGKSISLKVNSLYSFRVSPVTWRSSIDFDVRLGQSEPFKLKVPHGSATLEQDLDGCIAEGVMKLLNDDRVRQYLRN